MLIDSVASNNKRFFVTKVDTETYVRDHPLSSNMFDEVEEAFLYPLWSLNVVL